MTDSPYTPHPAELAALLRGATMIAVPLDPQPDLGSKVCDILQDRIQFWNRSLAIQDIPLPYAAGDRLWVREAFNFAMRGDVDIEKTPDQCYEDNRGFACSCGHGVAYKATGNQSHPEYGKAVWRRPQHMPRWASRLTLEVVDVRVMRAQDANEADAIACGSRPFFDHDNPVDVPCPNGEAMKMAELRGPLDQFRAHWDGIHGPGAWGANPWVAAYTVRRVE